ncbi:MAG: hypothetical protein QOK15_1788 [Nocardioidaceae bacterium]|jgi:hypothetical protein|nr:hypothetical protein [Nocardioidaceae bacterium]
MTEAGSEGRPPSGEPAESPRTDQGSDDEKRSGRSTLRTARTGVAAAIWLMAVLAALVLASGALVIALDLDRSNGMVSFVTHTADHLDFLGTLKRFAPTGTSPSAVHSALAKTVLVSWGICALVYLVVGKILDRVVRP